ncbi:hypothetical protein IHE45_19G163100 [Dioscorea alata]|uniref:Uncharacterized protein n=1 Tax=Dioscorea alata TaxID=55571 RepID=A0ACB7U3E8_DIOAL|nr:hypothetical protein IHE45_19G163100 [Dioscorea alata]
MAAAAAVAAEKRRSAASGRWTARVSSRPIPRRGQVKVAIVLGLVHSLASLFPLSSRSFQTNR